MARFRLRKQPKQIRKRQNVGVMKREMLCLVAIAAERDVSALRQNGKDDYKQLKRSMWTINSKRKPD